MYYLLLINSKVSWLDLTSVLGIILLFLYIYRFARATVTKDDLNEELIKKADEKIMNKELEIRDVKINSLQSILKEHTVNMKNDFGEFLEEYKTSIENFNKVAERLARGANKIEHLEESVKDLEKKVYKKTG